MDVPIRILVNTGKLHASISARGDKLRAVIDQALERCRREIELEIMRAFDPRNPPKPYEDHTVYVDQVKAPPRWEHTSLVVWRHHT